MCIRDRPTKAQVQELGLEDCVKFIGFRKDIKNLYKGSDLYVNSSQHEACLLYTSRCV